MTAGRHVPANPGARRPRDFLNTTTTAGPAASSARRPLPPEKAKILNDCRDLAVERLVVSFAPMLDRVGDMLMERGGKTDVREEQQLYLDARDALKGEPRRADGASSRSSCAALVDDRIAAQATRRPISPRSTRASSRWSTPVDGRVGAHRQHHARRREPAHDELIAFNRGIGYLLGPPDLETDAQSARAGDDRRRVRRGARPASRPTRRIKFQILKELNQAPLGDIGAIYADLNQHLTQAHASFPPAVRPSAPGGRRAPDRPRARAEAASAQGRRAPPKSTSWRMFRMMAVARQLRRRPHASPHADGRRARRRCRDGQPMGAPMSAADRDAAVGSRRSRRCARRRRATCRARRSSPRRTCTRA